MKLTTIEGKVYEIPDTLSHLTWSDYLDALQKLLQAEEDAKSEDVETDIFASYIDYLDFVGVKGEFENLKIWSPDPQEVTFRYLVEKVGNLLKPEAIYSQVESVEVVGESGKVYTVNLDRLRGIADRSTIGENSEYLAFKSKEPEIGIVSEVMNEVFSMSLAQVAVIVRDETNKPLPARLAEREKVINERVQDLQNLPAQKMLEFRALMSNFMSSTSGKARY